jgi:hypothetical protein
MPEPPAFTPSGWPSNPPPPRSVVAGLPVPPVTSSPPASFSFGDGEPLEPVLPESPPAAGPLPEPAQNPTSLAITNPPGSDPHHLEIELAAAQEELKALHEMLEDLPEIFERKFQQRLATVMEHQKHLLADNHALRERLYSVGPPDSQVPPRNRPLLLPTVPQEASWRQALRNALRLDRKGNDDRHGKATPKGINRHDDGRPISA